ncbi:MAG: carbohydrate porin [Cyanobium sp. LacPavin_0920_WC12_MAG_62_9]|nr:carbohydrate porin [Cyanobium sp. LacPavin_0920_WC12_MAG_62_9]
MLFTRLRAGNFAGSGFNGTPYTLSRLDVAFGTATNPNVVTIDRLYYRFPAGKELTFIVGPIMRNTEALAIEPFYYGDLKLLDAFTVHGAPGTYNKATGGGAGVIWRQNVKKGAPFLGASLSYVAPTANSAALNAAGGIMNNSSASSLTAQIGYQAQQWKTTFAWRYGSCGTAARVGTQAAVASEACPVNNTTAATAAIQPNAGWNGNNIDINNFAYTIAWTPKKNGTVVPSISAGWGYSAYNQSGFLAPTAANVGITSGISNQLAVNNIAATQSWSVALQWKDAFIKGNSAGMAVGQPNFVTALRNGQTAQDGNYVWEWWYKFQVTDKISVSPALFYISNPSSAGTVAGQSASTGANVFGGLVLAQFKF